jgi:hypothetical protein
MIEDDQPLSAAAREKIKALRHEQRHDGRIVMSPLDAERALGVKSTRISELINRGELSSLVDGKLRRIFVGSVYDYIVRRIILSDPLDGPPAKSPIGRFKSKPKEDRGATARTG